MDQAPVNQLINDLGLQGLPEDQQKTVLADFAELVQIRLGEKMAEQLSEAELEQFDQITSDEDEAKLLAYLQERFPNYQEILQQVITECKQELKDQSERLAEYLRQNQSSPPAS